MYHGGEAQPTGNLGLRVIKGEGNPVEVPHPDRRLRIPEILKYGLPNKIHEPDVNEWKVRNLTHFKRGLRTVAMARALHIPTMYGRLWLRVFKANGRVVDLGLASLRVITDGGVGYIVDAWQNTVELEIMNFHGLGLGFTAENQTDTDIETELTTQYTVDNTRATGSLTEGASANIFRTVGTNSLDATVALREHGILNNATVGSGVLFDRTVYALINLDAGDSLESTYDATFNANG
jgi:hypothetical protein